MTEALCPDDCKGLHESKDDYCNRYAMTLTLAPYPIGYLTFFKTLRCEACLADKCIETQARATPKRIWSMTILLLDGGRWFASSLPARFAR